MAKRDKTKDFLYNAIDYIVILAIICAVVVIIGWKFNLLFNKDKPSADQQVEKNVTEKEISVKPEDTASGTTNGASTSNTETSNQPGTTQPGATQPGTTQPGTTQPGANQSGTTQPGTTQPGTTQPGTTQPGTTQPGTTQPGTTQPGNPTTPTENTAPTGAEIKVTIPPSSLPGQIGEILAAQGLVESADAFVNKAVELKLDRVLKSGDFTLHKGMTLDQVVKVIAKTQ